jgi:hypothetical protein
VEDHDVPHLNLEHGLAGLIGAELFRMNDDKDRVAERERAMLETGQMDKAARIVDRAAVGMNWRRFRLLCGYGVLSR